MNDAENGKETRAVDDHDFFKDRSNTVDESGKEDEEFEKVGVCLDRSWLYDGHYGMMVNFDSPDFEESEYQDFLDEQEQKSSLDIEEEFVHLDFHHSSKEGWVRFNELVRTRPPFG